MPCSSHSRSCLFSRLTMSSLTQARVRFSLPAPSMPQDRHWAPYHAIMATPLLVSFELLLCLHLESSYGDVAALGWWDLFVNFGIEECFAFLVSTKWYNPRIHGNGEITESSSLFIRYEDRGSSLDRQQSGLCNLQNIGNSCQCQKYVISGCFFSPFLLQGAGVLFAAYRLVEKLVLLLYSGEISARYSAVASKAQDCFRFSYRGSRLLGWWSIDETSREEQARIYYDVSSKHKTFSPDVVKKMPRAALAKEICRLQAALTEQTDVTKFCQQQYERLQNQPWKRSYAEFALKSR